MKKLNEFKFTEVLSSKVTKEYLNEFKERINKMADLFNMIFLPLRFGVLALFDERKVSILDPKLLDLLQKLVHPTTNAND
jgi:hypothetical protein